MIDNERLLKITNYNKNEFIMNLYKISEEDIQLIEDVKNKYDFTASHNISNIMVRNSNIIQALNRNKENNDFILKAIELAIIFADESWRQDTLDLNLSQRAVAFSTNENNVTMYDAFDIRKKQISKKNQIKSL